MQTKGSSCWDQAEYRANTRACYQIHDWLTMVQAENPQQVHVKEENTMVYIYLKFNFHAKFNSLKRTYSSIRNPLDKLKSIMREHYLNIAPSMSAAVPPVEKRKKY